MNKIKVIIADDHILFREGTRHLLEQEQDIVVIGEASDGDVAVELVTKLHPQVALMDIAMPKVNGVEATRQTKTRHPATVVPTLTAYDNNQYVMALLEAGVAGYLLKNIGGNELAKAIRAVYAGEAVLQALRKGWLGLDDLA
jgi:NarL family two-component system response regulator LiaR